MVGATAADRGHRRGPGDAEALKPYYRFMCKRPCSNDEYLPTFNRQNVTLVDVAESKGVERLTEKGIVANGVEYEVDCVIFASGFEISTEISRRYAMEAIEGRDGCRSSTTGGMATRHCTGSPAVGSRTSSIRGSFRAASRPTPRRCSSSRPSTSPTSSPRR